MHFDCQIIPECLPSTAESLNHQSWPWLWPWPWLAEELASPKPRQDDVQASGYECVPPTPSCPPLHPASLLPLSSLWQVLFWWRRAGSAECLRVSQGRGASYCFSPLFGLPTPMSFCHPHPNLGYDCSSTTLPPLGCYSGSSTLKGWNSQGSVLSFLLSSVCTFSLWYKWMWVRFPDDSSNVNLWPRPLLSPRFVTGQHSGFLCTISDAQI